MSLAHVALVRAQHFSFFSEPSPNGSLSKGKNDFLHTEYLEGGKPLDDEYILRQNVKNQIKAQIYSRNM